MNDQQECTLNHLLTTLDVAESEAQLARVLSHRAFAAELHHGRGGTTTVASAVYTASRQAGQPLSLDEVADAAGVDRSELGRTYKQLVREFDLDIEPADPHKFVSRFGDQLELGESTMSTAHNVVDAASETGIRSGHSPIGTAAGALYLAGLVTGEHVLQREVVEATEVTPVTLRNRYQEQAMLVGIDRRKWSPPIASSFDASGLSIEAINEQLDRFAILDFAEDLFASHARCTNCERTGEYGHLIRNHYTQRIEREQCCYETAAELTEHLDGFEVLELDERIHSTRVRCMHCGREDSYLQLSDH
ncbi:transcription initiation factor IIB family protein [Saliphagus infecundisoli]|uniref:Cyclin-like domain-containing protein n=1 Tax=Saliphagus infecundisoli TaxID=1849069 RepID=A0ABD5QLC4_9EURY|nr:transcription initiation factor IIB family protein [Saliphagus infecundisoli]